MVDFERRRDAWAQREGPPAAPQVTLDPARALPGHCQQCGIRTARGTLIPPLNAQGPLGPPEELKAKIPKWADTEATMSSAVVSAASAEQQLRSITEAMMQFQTGAWQTDKAAFALRVRALTGVDVSGLLNTNPAAVYTVLHENAKGTLNTLKQANPRFAQMEFKTLSELSEHPDIPPEANLTMLSEDIATLQRAQKLPQDWQQARSLGWRNIDAFIPAWNAANPLKDDVQRVRDQIGPRIKGIASPNTPPVAIGPGGHKIVVENGKWVDAVTHQPIGEPVPPQAQPPVQPAPTPPMQSDIGQFFHRFW
jgi:hypothetical protein